MSSVFNGSEELYGTTVSRFALPVGLILFRTANAFWVTWSEGVRHRKALTEMEGMEMSTVASEKNREMLSISNLFY